MNSIIINSTDSFAQFGNKLQIWNAVSELLQTPKMWPFKRNWHLKFFTSFFNSSPSDHQVIINCAFLIAYGQTKAGASEICNIAKIVADAVTANCPADRVCSIMTQATTIANRLAHKSGFKLQQ